MKVLKNRKISFYILCALAVVVLVASTVDVSYSYFTTYVTVKGTRTITLESEVEIEEDVGDLYKKISITNTGKCPCWTRIKYFVPESFTYAIQRSVGENWVYDETDGYWYYTKQLQPGQSTNLGIADGTPDSFKLWADDLPLINGKLPEGFNIIVVAECVPVGDVDEKYNDANVNWKITADQK